MEVYLLISSAIGMYVPIMNYNKKWLIHKCFQTVDNYVRSHYVIIPAITDQKTPEMILNCWAFKEQ